MLLSASNNSEPLSESKLRVVINGSSVREVNTDSLVNRGAVIVVSKDT